MTDPAPSSAPMDAFRGDRVYLGADHARNERRTRIVAVICAVSLVAQVTGGLVFNSMALTAGGLHMAAHLAALLTASVAYAAARRYASDRRFSFGTGKLGYLAGFANAVMRAVAADPPVPSTATDIGIPVSSIEIVDLEDHPPRVARGSGRVESPSSKAASAATRW